MADLRAPTAGAGAPPLRRRLGTDACGPSASRRGVLLDVRRPPRVPQDAGSSRRVLHRPQRGAVGAADLDPPAERRRDRALPADPRVAARSRYAWPRLNPPQQAAARVPSPLDRVLANYRRAAEKQLMGRADVPL